MQCKLTEIGEIRQGIAFRSKLDHDSAGSIRVVQAKDLGAFGRIDGNRVVRVATLKVKAGHWLRAGDVVIQARGVTYPVAAVGPELGEAVAAAPLYVVRPSLGRLDPGYLVEFLANPVTQARLRQRATGTHVPQLARAEIENLEVPLPSLDDQRGFAELGALVRRECDLAVSLAERRLEALWALMRLSSPGAEGLVEPLPEAVDDVIRVAET